MRVWWLLALVVLSGCAANVALQEHLVAVCEQYWGSPLWTVMHDDNRTMECHYWSGEHDVTYIDENTTLAGNHIERLNITVT